MFVILVALVSSRSICDEKLEYSPSQSRYPFELILLPYTYSYIEPSITSLIIYAHHDQHHKTGVAKLNNYLSKNPTLQQKSLIDLIYSAQNDGELQKYAGGVYNHNMYWYLITSPKCSKKAPEGDLLYKIEEKWESFDEFLQEFKENMINLFGSGWVWACVNLDGDIELRNTANQINPLMQIGNSLCYPFLGNDLWEHAYYLQYEWERKEYVDAFLKVIDWDIVEMFYEMYASQHIEIPF